MPLKPEKPAIVAVCGPTGIGKTSTAITIAEAECGEIIGADSMQIYRYMDIGTAKPTVAEQARVTHHLVDVVDPDDDFDAAKFAGMAGGVITDLAGRGVLPVVAGGTGLYIKALTRGLFESVAGDPEIRANLRAAADEKGVPALFEELEKIDPQTAARIHPNDTYRVLRALEVYKTTGRSMSQMQAEHAFADEKYRCLKIGLTMDRETLYERINRRVDVMIEQGLEAEVRHLLDSGYAPELKAMQSLGYRHMAAYLGGQMDWDVMAATLKRDTRRYAKRQFTWFRADKDMHWFEPGDVEKILALVRRFLGKGLNVEQTTLNIEA
ncbi:MAG: tRNA (adenosine(37)-N6)-dimethylallyltransferase MiaA [Desulfobacterales bacterium]|nr:tRNA (adenosine(37)-N6)-dimethylallyltransferase MiaA [Desulfobacterales bacterium]